MQEEKRIHGDVNEDGTIFASGGNPKMDPKSFVKDINNRIVRNRKLRKVKSPLELRINRYKMKKGCSSCGCRTSPRVLCFDHLDKKKKKGAISRLLISHRETVSPLLRTKKRKAIFEEIRKCQILCANCHYLKTHLRKDYDPGQIPLYKNIQAYYVRFPHKKNSHIYLDNGV